MCSCHHWKLLDYEKRPVRENIHISFSISKDCIWLPCIAQLTFIANRLNLWTPIMSQQTSLMKWNVFRVLLSRLFHVADFITPAKKITSAVKLIKYPEKNSNSSSSTSALSDPHRDRHLQYRHQQGNIVHWICKQFAPNLHL